VTISTAGTVTAMLDRQGLVSEHEGLMADRPLQTAYLKTPLARR